MEYNYIDSPLSFDPDLIGKKSTRFTVEGIPFAKQRPRAARKGNFIQIYTPAQTKRYERKVADSYRKIYNDYILDGPLTVKIEAIFPIPNSVSKKKKIEMLSNNIPHIKKPDCDNTGKVILDGLNNVAYKDDAIINKLVITKKYGLVPRTIITIIQNHEEV